jgi:tRNA(Arg) A34 adenosine deaminase TadA
MNQDFLREAIRLSIDNLNTPGGGPFGAVVVRDGRIIGRGQNRVVPTNDPTAHAEVVAIRDACSIFGTYTLTGCEMYTSCEPCPMCLSAIYWAHLDRIHYAATRADADAAGFRDDLLYHEIALPRERRAIPMVHALQDEACEAFRIWSKREDRIRY